MLTAEKFRRCCMESPSISTEPLISEVSSNIRVRTVTDWSDLMLESARRTSNGVICRRNVKVCLILFHTVSEFARYLFKLRFRY